MNNAIICAVAGAVLCGGVVAGSWRPRHEPAGSRQPARILHYVDPMHPAYTSDRPGVAPDCGMPLRPVFDDQRGAVVATALGAASSGVVRLDSAQQYLAGVRTVAVEASSANERLHLYGRVVADETRTYQVNAGVDGVVRDLATVTTGSLVAKNAWLATISAPEARPAIQAYLVAVDVVDRASRAAESAAAVDFANGALQQAVDRLLTLGVSAAQIDTIRRTRRVPTTISIAAPESGFVIGRSLTLGQTIQRGDAMYQLADLRRVWVLADVSETDAERLTPAAAVDVHVPGRRAA